MSEENINFEEEPITEESNKEKKTWEEHLHVNSDELVGKVQELIREAAVRKITIKDENGKTVLDYPDVRRIRLTAHIRALECPGPTRCLGRQFLNHY